MAAIGIDFGTSAARAAVCADAEPKSIRTPDGAEEIETVVSFAQGGPHIGRNAASFAVMQARDTVCDLKSWLVAQPPDLMPSQLRAPGRVALEVDAQGGHGLRLGGQVRRPSSLAALVLRRMLELAAPELGPGPRAALLAHPLTSSAAFDAGLLAAAAEAGLARVDFVPEPIAAAAKLCGKDNSRPVFIADVGASHTSVSVVDVGPDRDPLLLHAVSEPLGGDALTFEILQRVTGGRDLSQLDTGMVELLRQYCEQMKKDLATSETASCTLPPMFVSALGCEPQLSLDRSALRDVSSALVHVIEDCCARALGGSAFANSDVELYVMGGSTRLPFVCAAIEKALGTRARVSRATNVIALGAAKLAAAKPPLRATEDVRTRASWRPPARMRMPTPVPATSMRPTPQPEIPREVMDAMRIPAMRVPVISPLPIAPEPPPPERSAPPVRPDARPLGGEPAQTPPPADRPLMTPPPAERRLMTPPAERPLMSAPPARPSTSGGPDSRPLASGRPDVRPLASARPTVPVQSISVAQIDAGHVKNPASAAELLDIPAARALRESDLEPISLPLLILLTGSKRRTGTLSLQMDDSPLLRVPFVEGKPVLSGGELSTLQERFKSVMGSYQFDEGRPDTNARRPEATLPLVVGGLRLILKGIDEANLRRALARKLALAPVVGANEQLRMGSLALTAMETRVVKFSLNGRNTGQGVAELSGIGTHTTLSLLYLLEIFGLIEWKQPEGDSERSLAEEIEARAKVLEASNYFQVLGVHWSANGSEIDAAYRKLVHELAEGQPVRAAAPEAVRRMLVRIEKARETLADHKRRDAYRRQTYPDINFDGVEDFLEKKHRSLAMQDASSEQAREVEKRMQEIARTKTPPRSKPPQKS